MKLCAFTSAERIPCPAYATNASDFCPVHRDQDSVSRVSGRGKHEPVLCIRCGLEIFVGALKKNTDAGPMHASYSCPAKQQK